MNRIISKYALLLSVIEFLELHIMCCMVSIDKIIATLFRTVEREYIDLLSFFKKKSSIGSKTSMSTGTAHRAHITNFLSLLYF